jgi:hypothetical protein
MLQLCGWRTHVGYTGSFVTFLCKQHIFFHPITSASTCKNSALLAMKAVISSKTPEQTQHTTQCTNTKDAHHMYLNPAHIMTFHLLKIHFSVTLPRMLKSCKWLLPFTFHDSNFKYISHVCHMYYVLIPSEPHLDNAELVSWSNSIEHAHTVHHLFQLMFSHTVNLISRNNLRVDCIKSYHRSWNTNTNIKFIKHAALCYTSRNTCYLRGMSLPLLANIRLYSSSNNTPIKD